MVKPKLALVFAAFAAGACSEQTEEAPASAPSPAELEAEALPEAISPIASTSPVENGSLTNAAFWRDDASGSGLIIGAAGIGGLDVYTPDGMRASNFDVIEAGLVTTVPASDGGDLLVVYDAGTSSLRAFRLDAENLSLETAMPEPLAVSDEVTGLCHYRSRLSGSDYVFATTDAGNILHFELFAQSGGVAGRLLRTIPSAKGTGFCATDPRDGSLYVAEETTGVWRIGAEAEDDTTREPVDLRAPFGGLSDDIKGIALYPVSADIAYLLVADIGNERIAVYRVPDGNPVGSFTVDNLGEPEGLALALPGFAGQETGLLAIADEDQGGAGSDIKLIELATLSSALGLNAAEKLSDENMVSVVRPVIETDVIPTWGDSADDPAIWHHPDDPALSLVIGTGKKSGLYVFDLDGNILQEVPDGRMNNVDVRDGFPLAGDTVPLVAASNRSNDGIAIYRIDVGTRRLVEVADGVLPTGFVDPYGLCLYHSPNSDEFHVFVNDADSGLLRQWRLADNGSGRVAAERVRDIEVGSQAEGCVVDDINRTLYVAEENVGLWKYSAEPDAPTTRVAIDSTGESGRLTADVEGIALYPVGETGGYLVVSNQGANNFAVYRRDGDNAFVGFFHIVANPALGIDGASETDGLDVSPGPLGDNFPDGLLVVQDGRNISPEERQNFKYVSWSEVAEALDLN